MGALQNFLGLDKSAMRPGQAERQMAAFADQQALRASIRKQYEATPMPESAAAPWERMLALVTLGAPCFE